MMKIIKERCFKNIESYELEFPFDGDFKNGGFAFPCDKEGNLLTSKMLNKIGMLESYIVCLKHPESFGKGVISMHNHRSQEPAIGICECGKEIQLWDEYLSACECPHCHRWHNLWGQELKDPKYWED